MDLVNQRKKWTQSISSNPFNREVDSNGRFLSVDINSEMVIQSRQGHRLPGQNEEEKKDNGRNFESIIEQVSQLHSFRQDHS